jgi:hypothetical protein
VTWASFLPHVARGSIRQLQFDCPKPLTSKNVSAVFGRPAPGASTDSARSQRSGNAELGAHATLHRRATITESRACAGGAIFCVRGNRKAIVGLGFTATVSSICRRNGEHFPRIFHDLKRHVRVPFCAELHNRPRPQFESSNDFKGKLVLQGRIELSTFPFGRE